MTRPAKPVVSAAATSGGIPVILPPDTNTTPPRLEPPVPNYAVYQGGKCVLSGYSRYLPEQGDQISWDGGPGFLVERRVLDLDVGVFRLYVTNSPAR